MAPYLDSVYLGYDNFFSRAGAVVTYPTGWTAPSRVHDGMDFLLAASGGAPPNPSYVSVDLGASGAAYPTFLYLGQTNLASRGVTVNVESSDDAISWTSHWSDTAESDQTSLFRGTMVPAVAHRYWRVGFTKGGGFSGLYVGELLLGVACKFSILPDIDGFDPTDEELMVQASRTEAGHLAHARFLGAKRRAHVRVSYASFTWTANQTVPNGFEYFLHQFVFTGKPFVWAWSAASPWPYRRDHFWAKCLGGARRSFGDSFLGGQRMVEFDVVGAREWGTY